MELHQLTLVSWDGTASVNVLISWDGTASVNILVSSVKSIPTSVKPKTGWLEIRIMCFEQSNSTNKVQHIGGVMVSVL